MKVYNTLTHTKELLAENDIGMYVCGPTVYDVSHIGHARSAYVFDVMVRYLRYKGIKVKFVRNVTDVDDKIINKAEEELSSAGIQIDAAGLKQKVCEISERYLKSYHEDMDKLGILRPDIEPKATETIDDMVAFIKLLMDKGYAYQSGDSVYFDVRKFSDYGRLSRQGLDQMEEGQRVALDKSKKDPLDFALWKAVKENEPYWDTIFGKGRPGWHIECSVMSTKCLGDKFIIHGGGIDLVFPHHENEIAQTVCAGKKSAKYWLHNGLLTINGQKMSKSLGNYVTIGDFLKKHNDSDYLKLFFLSSHYSSPADYTEVKIEEAKKEKERFRIFYKKIIDLGILNKLEGKKLDNVSNNFRSSVDKYISEFEESMDDDFNTPKALAILFDMITFGNKVLHNRENVTREDMSNLIYLLETISKLGEKVLGLDLFESKTMLTQQPADISNAVLALMDARLKAKKEKNFKLADELRREALEKYNVVFEDTKDGKTTWRKKD